MKLIETERLIIRPFTLEDSAFILQLLNEPSWKQYIGDKGIRTEDDAKNYLKTGPLQMYKDVGFGLYLVALKDTALPIGMCGLIKRSTLEDVDIGFAFLNEYTGKGFGYESAKVVIEYGTQHLGLVRIVAITTPDNKFSQNLLMKLGFTFEKVVTHGNENLNLYRFIE